MKEVSGSPLSRKEHVHRSTGTGLSCNALDGLNPAAKACESKSKCRQRQMRNTMESQL